MKRQFYLLSVLIALALAAVLTLANCTTSGDDDDCTLPDADDDSADDDTSDDDATDDDVADDDTTDDDAADDDAADDDAVDDDIDGDCADVVRTFVDMCPSEDYNYWYDTVCNWDPPVPECLETCMSWHPDNCLAIKGCYAGEYCWYF